MRKKKEKLTYIRATEVLRDNFYDFDDRVYMSATASSVISGIIRLAPTVAEAEAKEKENKRMAVSGRKCSNAGKLGKTTVTHNAKIFWADIQNKADTIWQNNNNLSCSQVAKSLKKKFPELLQKKRESTVRQRIKHTYK